MMFPKHVYLNEAGGAEGGAAAGGAEGGSPPWTATLDEDTRGFVEVKGFKTPGDVVQSYRNLEKLRGVPAERLLQLPDKADDTDAWGKIYDRLGRPAKAEEYKLPVPAGQDGEFAKLASGWFHEAGLSARQAQAVTAKWNEHMAALSAKETEDRGGRVKAEREALDREWGVAKDKNLQIARAAVKEFGLKPEMIDRLEDALGFGELMRFMHAVGSKLGEDSFVAGDREAGFGGLSAEGARARIDALKQDREFRTKLLNKDAEATAEWSRLHQTAYS